MPFVPRSVVTALLICALVAACSDNDPTVGPPDSNTTLDTDPADLSIDITFDLADSESDAGSDVEPDAESDAAPDLDLDTADTSDTNDSTDTENDLDTSDDDVSDTGGDVSDTGGDTSEDDAHDVGGDTFQDVADAEDADALSDTSDGGADTTGDATDAGEDTNEADRAACCVVDEVPGCPSAAVQSCVCALESSCCDEAWSPLCVSLVESGACHVCTAVGDVNEINDTRITATRNGVAFEQVSLSIHSDTDLDYFALQFDERGTVVARISFSNIDGDLDMALLNNLGSTLRIAQSTTDDEIINYPGVGPGLYYIRVFGWSGAVNDYNIDISFTPGDFTGEGATATLFSDLQVGDLRAPATFGSGLAMTLSLESFIGNVGTAPAPGADLGNATGTFRLIDAETGDVVAEGTKGPIFLTNNGGCTDPEIYDEWVSRGRPEMDGAEGAITTTDPGCVDFYTQFTNNELDTPLVIGDPIEVPDGEYFYELELDMPNTYLFEPDWTRANNRGWVRLSIGTAAGSRVVARISEIEQSGVTSVGSGLTSTVVGTGGAFDVAPTGTLTNLSAAIEHVTGLNFDSSGNLAFALWEAGGIWRDNGDGTSSELISGLSLPMGFVFLENNDLVVADYGANSLIMADASDDYANPFAIDVSGATLDQPTDVALGPDGQVYICNSGNHEILEIDLDSGLATRVAGTGGQGFNGDNLALETELSFPTGIDITDDGLLIIADGHNNRLRMVNLNTDEVLSLVGITIEPAELVTIAGAGDVSDENNFFNNETDGFGGIGRHARAAVLDWPHAPRVIDGQIFFLDADNHRVRLIDVNGYIHVVAGSVELPSANGVRPFGSAGANVGDGGSGIFADVNRPLSLQVLPDAEDGYDLFIADTDFYRVRLLSGVVVTTD